jgi:hypothetical protein
MTRFKTAMALLGAVTLGACSYEKNAAQDITAPATGAYVKFFNLGVNAPGLNFFANDTKITAISTTSCSPPPTTPNPACTANGAESTSGTAVGAVAAGGLYNVVPAGSVTLAGKIAAATDNGLAVAKTTATLAADKYYSYFTSGVYNAGAKTVDAFVIEDVLPAFDYTTAYVRFVNASANAGSVTLYAKNTTTAAEAPVGAAVAYKAGGAFVAVPAGTYDVSVRSGTTTITTLAATGFSAGRVYTVSLRGDATVTSTTAADRPILQSNASR